MNASSQPTPGQQPSLELIWMDKKEEGEEEVRCRCRAAQALIAREKESWVKIVISGAE